MQNQMASQKLGSQKIQSRVSPSSQGSILAQEKLKKQYKRLSPQLREYVLQAKQYEQQLGTYSADAEGVYAEILNNEVKVTDTATTGVTTEEKKYSDVVAKLTNRLNLIKTQLKKQGKDTSKVDEYLTQIKKEELNLSDIKQFSQEKRFISGVQKTYEKEKTEYLTALEKEQELAKLQKEAKEYELTAKEFQNRLQTFGTKYQEQTGDIINQLATEQESLGKEKAAVEQYTQDLQTFTPKGSVDERYEQILQFGLENPTLASEDAYFAGQRFSQMLEKGQKEGQNLTALGYDLKNIESNSELGTYVAEVKGTPVKYYNLHVTGVGNRWVREDVALKEYKPKFLTKAETKIEYEGASAEKWIGKDPSKQYLKIIQDGVITYKQKQATLPGKIKDKKEIGTLEYSPYVLELKNGSITETQYAPYTSFEFYGKRGGKDKSFTVYETAKAITQDNILKEIQKQNVLVSDMWGDANFSGTKRKTFVSEKVSFDAGKLKQKEIFGTYDTRYERLFDVVQKNNKNWVEAGAFWKNQAAAQKGIISYGNMSFSTQKFNLPQTKKVSTYWEARQAKALIDAGVIKSQKQQNLFNQMTQIFGSSSGMKLPVQTQAKVKNYLNTGKF